MKASHKQIIGGTLLSIATLGTFGTFALQSFADTGATSTSQNEVRQKRTPPTEAQIAEMKAQHEKHKAVMDALEAGDYAAFHIAVADNAKASAITSTQFDILVQARKIMEDAQLMPQGRGPGMHQGMMHENMGTSAVINK